MQPPLGRAQQSERHPGAAARDIEGLGGSVETECVRERNRLDPANPCSSSLGAVEHGLDAGFSGAAMSIGAASAGHLVEDEGETARAAVEPDALILLGQQVEDAVGPRERRFEMGCGFRWLRASSR